MRSSRAMNRRVGKGALAPCPPSIIERTAKWWARCALPTLPNYETYSASHRNELFARARALRLLHLRRLVQIARSEARGISHPGIARHHGGDDGAVDQQR